MVGVVIDLVLVKVGNIVSSIPNVIVSVTASGWVGDVVIRVAVGVLVTLALVVLTLLVVVIQGDGESFIVGETSSRLSKLFPELSRLSVVW